MEFESICVCQNLTSKSKKAKIINYQMERELIFTCYKCRGR